MDQAQLELLLQGFELNSHQHALDLGCGKGSSAKILTRLGV
jgi:cyclopropane fatty-acyl-phospholipid synthase-like methyltransferase